ncbi:MAG: DUF177 domain-containing protein [Methylococcales bacterium]|nr:DUF177 domain-containing protein [Methylococcales bacterium]
MLDRLPVVIEPLGFAERGKRLVGALKVSEFIRLSGELLDNSGVVEIDFSFDKEGRLAIVSGEIKANLNLQCQSCLGQFVLSINRQFKLGLVSSMEQADRLASDCEPLILNNKKISLNELVEDELLLALPDFPRHEYECSEMSKGKELEVNNDEQQQMNSNNPFSVLAELKNTGD